MLALAHRYRLLPEERAKHLSTVTHAFGLPATGRRDPHRVEIEFSNPEAVDFSGLLIEAGIEQR
ncbi:MAG: hypothetical protein AB1331_09420 [Bacillota bacterium]